MDSKGSIKTLVFSFTVPQSIIWHRFQCSTQCPTCFAKTNGSCPNALMGWSVLFHLTYCSNLPLELTQKTPGPSLTTHTINNWIKQQQHCQRSRWVRLCTGSNPYKLPKSCLGGTLKARAGNGSVPIQTTKSKRINVQVDASCTITVNTCHSIMSHRVRLPMIDQFFPNGSFSQNHITFSIGTFMTTTLG